MSASSNYHFIDASSLSENMDVSLLNVVGYLSSFDKCANWLQSTTNSSYILSTWSNNVLANNDLYKLVNQKKVREDYSRLYSSANKESLVVEIKEADSGESTKDSPCSGNTNMGEEEGLRLVDAKEEGEEETPSLIRRNTFELEESDEKLSSLQQEYERRQGTLVFRSCITQYSHHLIDSKMYFEA